MGEMGAKVKKRKGKRWRRERETEERRRGRKKNNKRKRREKGARINVVREGPKEKIEWSKRLATGQLLKSVSRIYPPEKWRLIWEGNETKRWKKKVRTGAQSDSQHAKCDIWHRYTRLSFADCVVLPRVAADGGKMEFRNEKIDDLFAMKSETIFRTFSSTLFQMWPKLKFKLIRFANDAVFIMHHKNFAGDDDDGDTQKVKLPKVVCDHKPHHQAMKTWILRTDE